MSLNGRSQVFALQTETAYAGAQTLPELQDAPHRSFGHHPNVECSLASNGIRKPYHHPSVLKLPSLFSFG